MSGGSMDYLCFKIHEAYFKEHTIERKALREHLIKLAKALKAVEWNDSGDGASNEEELIIDAIGERIVLDTAIKEAEDIMEKLKKLIENKKEVIK